MLDEKQEIVEHTPTELSDSKELEEGITQDVPNESKPETAAAIGHLSGMKLVVVFRSVPSFNYPWRHRHQDLIAPISN